MTSRFAVLGVAASVLLLVGCGSPPALPAGLSPADTKAFLEQRSATVWAQTFPGEPLPVVGPVATVSPKQRHSFWAGCMLDADIPGVAITYEGAVSQGTADPKAFARQGFVCELEYPLDPTKPEELGLLSDAQLKYLYGYYTTRLVPCLRSIGFSLQQRPSLATYLRGGAGYWLPYYDMAPVPSTDAEWNMIDLRCPPPPYLADARPGRGYPGVGPSPAGAP